MGFNSGFKGLKKLEYYVPTELFVHASVTREEGIRSLEHSDVDMANRLDVMLLI